MAQIKMQYGSDTRQKTSFIIMNGANKRNVINLITSSDASIQSVDAGYLWNSTGTGNTHFFLVAKPDILSGRYVIEIDSDLTTNPKINFGYRLQDNDVISTTVSDYSLSPENVGKSTQVFDYTQGKYIALLIGTDGSAQVVNKIISSIKIRPVRLVNIDLIKQMQNKQGYTNGTSTGSFTDSQISYDVQASPDGYWEYTVYGKLDISKIKGKTFKIIYNFEDIVLPAEINRSFVRVLYSADGNYILPTSPSGGLASGINWCGFNGVDLTTASPTTSGNQQIIQNGMPLFSGVSDDIVDLYITCLYSPQYSGQTTRPSGKLSIKIEELPSKQYLYKNGNQYTSKTGGYTSNGYEYYNSAGVHRTTVNPTYNSDYVNIISIDNYACIMGTQNKVNIAGYKTLHILYKPNYIYSDAIVIIISTSKELKTTTGVEKLRQLINSTNTNMQELSFDISNINEQCYVVVLNENNSERNINIYEIWLES